MSETYQPRRALLFMPGDDLKKIQKAAALDLDSFIIDLEDAVSFNNKETARQTAFEALTSGMDFGRAERMIRLNPAESGLMEADFEGTVEAKPDAYVLPKVERAKDIRRLSDMLEHAEQRLAFEPGGIRIFALVETARGITNLRKIASADPRLQGLMFGAEDLAGSMGAVRTPTGQEIAYARSAVVIHAAAYGLDAIDTPYIDYQNLDGLRAETELIIQMGYTGKLAIHPAQVDVIHEVFQPTPEELAHARALIAAFDQQQSDGKGVFSYEGKMIDMPMIRAAQRVVQRAGAVE